MATVRRWTFWLGVSGVLFLLSIFFFASVWASIDLGTAMTPPGEGYAVIYAVLALLLLLGSVVAAGLAFYMGWKQARSRGIKGIVDERSRL